MSEPAEDLGAIRQLLLDLPERLGRVLGQLSSLTGIAPGLAGAAVSAAGLPPLAAVQPDLRHNPALDDLMRAPALATPTLPAQDLRHNPDLDSLMGMATSPAVAGGLPLPASQPQLQPATGLPGMGAGGPAAAGAAGAVYGEAPGWTQELIEAIRENTEELRKSKEPGRQAAAGKPADAGGGGGLFGPFFAGAEKAAKAWADTPGTSGTQPTAASSGSAPWLSAIARIMGGS